MSLRRRRALLAAGFVLGFAAACDAGTVVIGIVETPDAGAPNAHPLSDATPPIFDANFDADFGPCLPDGGCPTGLYCYTGDSSAPSGAGASSVDGAAIDAGPSQSLGGPKVGDCYLIPPVSSNPGP